MKNINYRKCLELNSSYLPTKIIDSDRAYVLYLKGNAEIIHSHPEPFNLVKPEPVIYRPSVIKVGKYFEENKLRQMKFSREAVFKRDKYTCVYCNKEMKKSECTIDHVNPKSKKGKDSFENCVTACKKCNQEKDNLTIQEWGREHPNPKRPHYVQLLTYMNITEIPEDWKHYLLW